MIRVAELTNFTVTGNLPISIVIPCHLDADHLMYLLQEIISWKEVSLEVITVLSCETPISEELSDLLNFLDAKIIRCNANRGLQLKKGADAAKGALLWFLYSDVTPDNLSILSMRRAICSGKDSGAFSFEFSNTESWAGKLITPLIKKRSRSGHLYGDQGIFVSRELYNQVGGFEPWPIFEDVALVKKLKEHGQFILLDNKMEVNSRRWEQKGWIKNSLLNRIYSFAYWLGFPPEKIAKWYWR